MGIRRYQPYSVKPRQSGKGGKEIGEARKNSKSSLKDRIKIGKRRYQNEDGTFTDSGIKKYRKRGYELSTSLDKDGNLIIRDESKDVKSEFKSLKKKAHELALEHDELVKNNVANKFSKELKNDGKEKIISGCVKNFEAIRDHELSFKNSKYLEDDINDVVDGQFMKYVHEDSKYGKKISQYELKTLGFEADLDKAYLKLLNSKGKDILVGFDKGKQVKYHKILRNTLAESGDEIFKPGFSQDLYPTDMNKQLQNIREEVYNQYKKKYSNDPVFK